MNLIRPAIGRFFRKKFLLGLRDNNLFEKRSFSSKYQFPEKYYLKMEATTPTEALTLEEPQILTITETEVGTQPARNYFPN
jgi:hypothetical protein